MAAHTRYANLWPAVHHTCVLTKGKQTPVRFMGHRSQMQILYRNEPESVLALLKAELLRISKQGGQAANTNNWLDLCGAPPPPPIGQWDSTVDTLDATTITWDSTV